MDYGYIDNGQLITDYVLSKTDYAPFIMFYYRSHIIMDYVS